MYMTNTDTQSIINAIDRNTDKLLAVLTDTSEDCSCCIADDSLEYDDSYELAVHNAGVDADLRVYTKDFADHCMTRFSAGTSGYHGGDACHGCETVIEIEDLGCTDLHILVSKDRRAVRIVMGGDRELDHLIDGLRFMADTLERNADAAYPGRYA